MASHELSGWKRELAAKRLAELGKFVPTEKEIASAERWAQRQAKENSEVWRKFVAGKGAADARLKLVGQSPFLVAPDAPYPAPMIEDFSHLPEPVRMERSHWVMWERAHEGWRQAEHSGDDLTAIQFSAMTIKLREAWEKARRDREGWEIANRKLAPIGEIEAVLQKFAHPLRTLLENIENELATLVNPDDPQFARRKIAEWKHERLFPPIADLINGLESLAA